MINSNKQTRLTLRRFSCCLTLMSLLISIACVRLVPPESVRANAALSDQIFAQQLDSSKWRRTRQGWVDSSKWYRPPRVEFERRIELVHPLTFSAMMVLFAVGALIWASEEYDWGRLIRRKH